MKTFKVILFSVLSFLLIVLIVLFFLIQGISNGAKPVYEGELVLKGLEEDVSITRDERGMPHIYAANEHDLYMAVGFVMAQERMWQMDLIRRATTGELSEIFGEDYVQTDLFLRSLKMSEKSEKVIEDTAPEIIACLEYFVEGVNYYIENAGKKLPPEFRILGYEPDPWTIHNAANIIGYMGWDLASGNLSGDVFIYKLIDKLGLEQASRLIPYYDYTSSPVYPGFKLNKELLAGVTDFVDAIEKVEDLGINAFHGSNNWAVSAARSETGMPILANDMHLSLSNPGTWIQMHHVIPGKLNVTGVVVPGQPFIIGGHNENIAWGMTNLAVDDIDLYLEKTNPEKTSYLYDGEWREIKTEEEIIKVKKGEEQVFDLKYTHRGPIISGFRNIEDADLSMRWSGYDMSNELAGVYLLNKAENWDDFNEALSHFNSVSQNFIYADIKGNIGLHAGGGVPIREAHGAMVLPGDTSLYEWKGYVPHDQLPFSYNPENGMVSSANNKTVGPEYPHYIGTYFSMPYRINRVRQMLSKKIILGIDDFKSMITDRHSDYAAKLMPQLLDVLQKVEDMTELERELYDNLAVWDYDMSADLIAPTFFEYYVDVFAEYLLADDMGDIWDGFSESVRDYYILMIITGEHNLYIDDINTDETESLEEIMAKAFSGTIDLISEKHSSDVSKWLWGDLHQFTANHPMGTISILDRIFGLNTGPFRVGGSDHTVSPYSYSGEFLIDHGASERHIFNTADWDESYTVLPTGISGVPSSEFYGSQTKTYCEDRFYKDHFSEDAVKKAAKYVLILKPEAE